MALPRHPACIQVSSLKMMNFLPSWRSFWVLSNSQFWDLRCSSTDDITLNLLRSPVCWRVNSKLKTLIWIPLECFWFLPNSYTLFHIKSWNSLSTQEHLLFPKFWDISLTALWRIQSIPQWPFPHFNYSQNNIFYIFFSHCFTLSATGESYELSWPTCGIRINTSSSFGHTF